MSDENNVEEKKQDNNSRGKVGKATPGLTMRQRWNEAGRVGSLKSFARGLAKNGDQVAKDWFNNKRGRFNQKRTDANKRAASEASQATKAAKKKKK